MSPTAVDSLPPDLLIQSIPSVLLVYDGLGRLQIWNAAARTSLGLREQASAEEVEQVLGEELGAAVRACLATATAVRVDETGVEVSGRERIFGFTASPIRRADGVSGAVVTGKDITERVSLSKEIQRLEKTAQIEKVVRKVTHELRNPLNAIRGYAQYFAMGFGPEDPSQHYASVIMKAADRMDRILEGLRDFSGVSRLEVRLADPEPCLAEAARTAGPLMEQKAAKFSLELSGPFSPLPHDPARLLQVLLNLLRNAAEAIEFGGHVALRAGSFGDGGLWVEVADDGPGVDPSLGDSIFDLFVTSKGKAGEGIGLALSQEIVNQHGGQISYASSPGQGALFRVEIPAR